MILLLYNLKGIHNDLLVLQKDSRDVYDIATVLI